MCSFVCLPVFVSKASHREKGKAHHKTFLPEVGANDFYLCFQIISYLVLGYFDPKSIFPHVFLTTVYVETRSQRTNSSSPNPRTHESKEVL